jgi:hypothetical protein
MMLYGRQTQELTISAFPLSQVVIVVAMVVSAVLQTTLSSLVRLRTAPPTPLPAACSTMVMWGDTTASVSRSASPSVALGINHFNIWWERLAVCRRAGFWKKHDNLFKKV